MTHPSKRFPWLLLLLASAACGSSGGQGRVPDEAVLCSLAVGQSTTKDAVAALGKPSVDTVSPPYRLLQWQYDVSGSMEIIALQFRDDVFVQPTVAGLSLPDCWTPDGGL